MTLVFQDATAALLFWTTYAAFAAVDARLILRSLSGREHSVAVEGPRAAHRPAGLVLLLIAEAAALAAAGVDVAVLPWRWPLLYAGIALAWTGLALRVWAKRTLGRFFVGAVVIQPGHRVVTDGPYAHIRHPGYAGAILAMTGLGIATANVLSMAIFALGSTIVFTRTIVVEEATLSTQLGPPYLAYRQRTTRLVPRLW